MFCHRSRQETQRNTTCPNLQCFGYNEGCISPWFPSRGRHHWTICQQGKTMGGDDTGRFASKGKLTFLKVLEELDSDNDKVHVLAQLVEAEQLSEATINVIESIVCQLYLPHTELTNVADASSWLFKKKQGNLRGIPTKASLHPALL